MPKKKFEEVMKDYKPSDGESKNEFISRCVKDAMDEGIDQQQALGKCYGMWEQKRDKLSPKKGEGPGVESTLSGGLLTIMSP